MKSQLSAIGLAVVLLAGPAIAGAAPVAARPKPRPIPDYSARERRLDALIANAESRDVSGDTQRDAAASKRERARCATAACFEASYARQERALRQWEGAEAIMREFKVR